MAKRKKALKPKSKRPASTAHRGKTTFKHRRSPCRTVAAVDVGATSIRMAVAEMNEEGERRILEELVHPVSLGADTFRVGHLTPKTMRAASKVLKNFAKVLAQYKVRMADVRAVATSALRDATNQDVVIDRIRHDSGITLHVLDAVEESRLTYQALLPFLQEHLPDKGERTMLLDLGGGSTEIMILKGADLVFAGTRRLGTSRIFHTISCSDCGDTEAMLQSVIRNVVSSTEDLYRSHPVAHCVVINGLLTRTLAEEPGVQLLPNGLILPAKTVRRVVKEAEKLSLEQRTQRFGISPAEGELLLPALLITGGFLDSIKVKQLYFAEVDLLAGLLNDILLIMRGTNPLQTFSEQILGSAAGIAEKFHYDRAHAEQVTRLSSDLFEALAGFFDLNPKDLLLLRVAAVLHDIGMFLSERAHHKHGAYLTRWSEIVGLSDEDREVIAQIVRYHRKATPRDSHPEFKSLSEADRMRVTKLASILRMADALDRRHNGNIRSIDLDLTDAELIIAAKARADLTIETMALRSKGNLFENITGLRCVLRRAQ